MSALTTFLLARIAEDEEVARATAIPPWTSDGHYVGNHTWIAEVDGPEDGRHIARWDPARVLAECEAKRAIVGHCASGLANGSFGESTLAEATVRCLAQVYADHQDFDPAWAPV